LLFENFEMPSKFIAEVLLEKMAIKLMNENNNLFENLVQQFSIKFGRLQITGYHGRPRINSREPRPDSIRLNDNIMGKPKPIRKAIASHVYGSTN
jgi:hypothetical protein